MQATHTALHLLLLLITISTITPFGGKLWSLISLHVFNECRDKCDTAINQCLTEASDKKEETYKCLSNDTICNQKCKDDFFG